MYKVIVFSLLLTPSSSSIAQPVITRNHLMFPGDEFFVAGTGLVPHHGNGGANVNWDFSSVQQNSMATNTVENSDDTEYASDFPDENIAFLDQTPGSPFYQYELITENVWEEHGYVVPENSVVTFDNPRTYLQFPFTYDDQWQDAFSYEIEYQTDPPFITFGAGIIDVRVDGYGTLVLPQSTFDEVLRVRIIAETTDTTVLGAGLYERNYFHDTTFIWFSPLYHGPLCTHVNSITMRTTTVIAGDTLHFPETLEYHGFSFDPLAESSSSVYDELSVGIHALNVSPNPIEEAMHVEFTSDHVQEMVFLLQDLNGHVLYTVPITALHGENNIDIILPEIPSGTYVAVLQSVHGTDLKKLIRINGR